MFCAGSTGTEGRPRCGSQASATSTLNTRGSILTRSYRYSNGKLVVALKRSFLDKIKNKKSKKFETRHRRTLYTVKGNEYTVYLNLFIFRCGDAIFAKN